MSGVSLGFWTPAAVFKDPSAFASHVFDQVAGSDQAFPLRMTPIEALGRTACYVAAVSGHIPMHNDSQMQGESTSKIFQFIVATRNRPVMLTAPRTMANDMAMVNPANQKTFALGCFELRAGMVCHFDTAQTWHGISALPAPSWGLPDAVIIQVPWPHPHEIQNALSVAIRSMKADAEFGEFLI